MVKKIKKNLKTKILGKNIKYFQEINSTQLVAKQMADSKVENGTIILAENQYDGVGTHDRKWYSEAEKNILFTLILYPKCKINELSTITVDIAKCLINTVEKLYNYKLDIKNPNDIMYNSKKIGGILTQIITNGEKIKYLLIGIGMNVNQDEFPKEIENIASSLKKEFGIEFSREEIIAEFCNTFEEYCKEKKVI